MPDTTTTTTTEDKVSNTSIAYDAMSPKWDLPHALLGETKEMRSKGIIYLPQHEGEKQKDYTNRLNRTFLFNAYGDTIKKIVAKPFSRNVTIKNLPENLDIITVDVNGMKQDITQFAREVFRAGAGIYGLTHILVDFPQVKEADKKSKADENIMGLRPKWTHITPPNLIAWNVSLVNGNPTLDEIRFKETSVEHTGQYKENIVHRIRVLRRDTWEVFRKDDKEKYNLEDKGINSLGFIPLATFYANRTGYLTADPTMGDLAWLNLAHWQSSSDQSNILHYGRFAQLFFAGFSKEEIEKGIAVGPNQRIATPNENAKVSYIEVTGKAIEAGQKDLTITEERMEILGAQPFLQRKGNIKATGIALNEGRSQSTIQAWIRSLEGTLKTAYEYTALWIGTELPDDFNADIYSDFPMGLKSSDDMNVVLKMRQMQDISQSDILIEAKRRDVLSDNLDVEATIDATESEGPALGTIGIQQ